MRTTEKGTAAAARRAKAVFGDAIATSAAKRPTPSGRTPGASQKTADRTTGARVAKTGARAATTREEIGGAKNGIAAARVENRSRRAMMEKALRRSRRPPITTTVCTVHHSFGT